MEKHHVTVTSVTSVTHLVISHKVTVTVTTYDEVDI